MQSLSELLIHRANKDRLPVDHRMRIAASELASAASSYLADGALFVDFEEAYYEAREALAAHTGEEFE